MGDEDLIRPGGTPTGKATPPPPKTRLWEVDHPYYCNEGNYFKAGLINEYDTWREFVNEEGDADVDYNLVFRWDWRKFDPADYTDEPFPDHDMLQICWMTQRKGYYRTTLVKVQEADEPEVRKWLLARYAHMLLLWAPLVPGDVPAGATYADLMGQVKDAGNVLYGENGLGEQVRERISGKELDE